MVSVVSSATGLDCQTAQPIRNSLLPGISSRIYLQMFQAHFTSLHFTSLNISYFIVFAARYLYYFILILCTYTCLMVIVCCALFQCNFTCSSVLFSTEELPCGILRNHSGIYLISSDTYHSKFTSMRSGWPTQFYCNHGKTSESNRSYRCNVFLILVVFQQSRLHRGNMQTSESDHQRSCR